MLNINIPAINDDPGGFKTLFNLWEHVNAQDEDVRLGFGMCSWLGQNAVAFLGGMVRMLESKKRKVELDISNLREGIKANLTQNGFLWKIGATFLPPWKGNSIPYREDKKRDAEEIITYLTSKWLVRGWVNVSNNLRDEIAGRVWEIYDNAFDHAASGVGVYTCGQYFPKLKLLKLTVLDFGQGIPSNVRGYLGQSSLHGYKALQWAFQRGNSTKPGSRGIGLDLLKEFIRLNNGRAEIYSEDSYGIIASDRERYIPWETPFKGTVFNITLCCDSQFYCLADEAGRDLVF